MSQDIKCYLGVHKYEVLSTEILQNPYKAIIGKIIVSRCKNCGKIKHTTIYTDTYYKNN